MFYTCNTCVEYTPVLHMLSVCLYFFIHLIHHTCTTDVWITPDTPHVYYRCVNYTWYTTRVLQVCELHLTHHTCITGVCELHLTHHTCITGVWITPDTPHLYYIAKYGPVFEINIIKGKSLSSLRALAGGWKINSDFHILVMWRSIFYLSYAARWKR